MKKEGCMKKPLKITLIVISSFLVLIMGFLAVYFFWPWNKDFFDKAKEEFAIPGLEDGFVPQGFTKIDGTKNYLICGYMVDGSPSRAYHIDGETGEVIKYVTFKMSDTEADYVGHAGGIASYANMLWIVGDGYVYYFSTSLLNSTENTKSLHFNAYMEVPNGADFVYAQKTKVGENETPILWIGEFYKEKKYETPEKHHLKTRSGETNMAVAYGYEISATSRMGMVSKYTSNGYVYLPKYALSMPNLVQGMGFSSDGKIVLSTSWSLSDSTLRLYKNVFEESAHSTIKYGLYAIDLWFLDDNALISDTKIPAMSEEIVIYRDIVYILFESKCKKYKYFNRVALDSVYSLPISAL